MTMTIDLQPTAPHRRDDYGLLLESPTTHDVTGAGVHNPAHGHTVQVWQDRDEDRWPTGSHRFVLAAQPTVVAKYATGTESPRGWPLAIGDTVYLTVNGYPLGSFRIEARPLQDPCLVPVT